jgi:hypothetical protein
MIARIIPILLILIAIGLFFGYIHPTYTGNVAALRAEIGSYDAALLAAAEFAEKENELLAEQSAIPTEGMERVEAFLPDGVDNVQLILDLNALAARSGLTLSDFDTSDPTAGESGGDRLDLSSDSPVDSIDLSVSAIGEYSSFRTFLKGVELSLRPMDLVELTIGDSPTGVYDYDMTFRIYWLR